MKVFNFDPADYRAEYERQGWIHIRGGIPPEFLESAREFSRKSRESTRLEGYAIKGKKEQSLFEFPAAADFPGELFDVLAELCGLARETITLSERHIQAYEPNAAPEPAAHKDRFSSQVSVGFSIDIPAASKLVLYPYDYREVNPFNSSGAYYRSLPDDRKPEVVLKSATEVVIDDEPGDLVAFPGSTTWHLRRNAASSINLYCKFNDFGSDPLGEDPRTDALRSRTLQLLDGTDEIASLVPVKANRLDLLSRAYTRTRDEALLATVWGDDPLTLTLTELEYNVLESVDGRMSIEALASGAGNGAAVASVEDAVRRLARAGAVELLG